METRFATQNLCLDWADDLDLLLQMKIRGLTINQFKSVFGYKVKDTKILGWAAVLPNQNLV